MRQRAEDAGALFLIAKPFTPEGFQEALEPLLG
jgi:two-component system chemotaxis response regulator CheY